MEKVDGRNVTRTTVENAYFLPETVAAKGEPRAVEKRSRGTQAEVVLLCLRTSPSRGLHGPNFGKLGIAGDRVLWEQAYVAVGIPDTRGIPRGVTMEVERPRAPVPSRGQKRGASTGMASTRRFPACAAARAAGSSIPSC